jgi:HEPN domain-containing protein
MFKKQKFYKRAIVIGIMLIITLFVVNAMGQKQAESMESKDLKTVLFKDVNATMEAAKTAQADILAPDNFGEAMKLYKKAEVDLKKGENLDDIRKNLRESGKYFKKAIDATKLAEVTFPNLMKARNDAQFTEAPKFAANLWKEAEGKFKDAAIELEGGDVNDAKEEAGEAETLYRKSELAAIKANYLDETRRLLKQADDSDVEDYAPKTLKLSQQLVKQAEKELNDNRYDTDVARGLARQANYQAKHAIYLANTIEQMKDKDNTWEDLMLASEKPLQQIAEQTHIIASFENGVGKTTDEIINYITTNKDRVAGLSQDLYLSKVETDLQHARIAEMEKQLGSQANEKSSLANQIANQAKSREQFASVEKSFSNDEALVLREGNDYPAPGWA